MPNHVHVVLQPFEFVPATARGDAGSVPYVPDAASVGELDTLSDEVADGASPLSTIMHSLKSYTANRANALLNREGTFWQRESYDHWVRSIDELERIVDYVRMNPVRAGLCQHPEEWRFSSAYDRFQQDGSRCGLTGWLRGDWRRPHP